VRQLQLFPSGNRQRGGVLGDSRGILRAFDATTGDVLGALDLGAGISSGPALVDGMVIVGAGTGGFGRQGAPGVYGLAVK